MRKYVLEWRVSKETEEDEQKSHFITQLTAESIHRVLDAWLTVTPDKNSGHDLVRLLSVHLSDSHTQTNSNPPEIYIQKWKMKKQIILPKRQTTPEHLESSKALFEWRR